MHKEKVVCVGGQSYGRGGCVVLLPFGHFFFSRSVSLARVTPLFLAVVAFLSLSLLLKKTL